MGYISSTMIIRRDLLKRIITLFYQGKLNEEIDRIPLKMAPKNSEARHRCSIHKVRAVIKYKMFPILGYATSDEIDELTPLSYYSNIAQQRNKPDSRFITVVDEACTSCVKAQYVVSNLCRGCVAKSCMMNCPKNSVSINKSGQAEIDSETCVNCGICKEQCQYHAIIYQPIPCEAACPVGAISKNENKIEEIDYEKCIYCGRCLQACPFGSIFEISHIIDVLSAIERGEKLTALFAPSMHGQFGLKTGQMVNLFRILGFSNVVEVAEGAKLTTNLEAAEWKEKISDGQKFLTTSCCPGYVEAAKKHVNSLMNFVSQTPSPMAFAAQISHEQFPGQKTVFIGPCIAKRKEAFDNPQVDFVLSFEEINAIIVALNLDLGSIPDDENFGNEKTDARGFAITGGVANAVKNLLPNLDVKPLIINGLDKKGIAMLKAYAKGKVEANLIEVMCCEGGCIAGPGGLGDFRNNQKLFNSNLS